MTGNLPNVFKSNLIILLIYCFSSIAIAAPADDFVITIRTNNPGVSSATEFLINVNSADGYNFNVDCNNDGIDEATAQTDSYTCDYSSLGGEGDYTIRIKDNTGLGTGYHRIAFFFDPNDLEKIIELNQWGTSKWSNMNRAFSGATNLIVSATDVPDLSLVEHLSFMFTDAILANPDTSNWNTATVTSMSAMFFNASSANPDTSNWITDSVTDMRLMFEFAIVANPDTTNWNTGLVTNMSRMFRYARVANPDTSSWNTSAVTDMSRMFDLAYLANPNISNWDISSVVDMSYMFNQVTLPTSSYDAMLLGFNNQNLQNGVSFSGGNSKYCSSAAEAARANMISSDNWVITDGGKCEVTDPADDFVITIRTNNPGTSSSTEFFVELYGNGYNYNIDCNNDGVDEATSQTGSYTCDYSSLGGEGDYTIRFKDNTGLGTGFSRLFGNIGDNKKLIDLNQWGTSKWSTMNFAFSGARNLFVSATDVPDLSLVTNTAGMFDGAYLANPNTSNWNVSSVRSMNGMFSGARVATPDTSNWDTSSVENMSVMFEDAFLANPDTSNWNTAAVTKMNAMFKNAKLANPDTSSWNTDAVTNMSKMFYGASIANPDTSGWNTAVVTDMSEMFRNASLANPSVNSWDISSVSDMTDMFAGVTIPTVNYDSMLIGFNNQNLQTGVSFGGGNSKYCSPAADAARTNMISSDNWIITDGGECENLVFRDGFEIIVIVFKTIIGEVDYDFSEVDSMQLDIYPQVIAKGLDEENNVNLKVFIRKLDEALQIKISHLYIDDTLQDRWTVGEWEDFYNKRHTKISW